MSTKSPPKRSAPRLVAPTSVPRTRARGDLLHTRQRRTKERSIRKISEMTQMLLTPITEFTPKVKTKRSPKEKPAVSEKQTVVKAKGGKGVVEPVEGEVKRRRGRKRKAELLAERKAKREAKRAAESPEKPPTPPKTPPRAVSPPRELTMSDLIALAEEESLDDEDFMEILTCESPVWWEDPPSHEYSEDPIFPKTMYAKHYEELMRCNDKAKLSAASIGVPEIKHIDYKFIKKRAKLESILGNIKDKKLNNSKPKEKRNKRKGKPNMCRNVIEQVPPCNGEKTKAVTNSACEKTVAETTVKETEMKRVKKCSESTEGSISGLINEDLLRDLENMDIPMETDVINNTTEENCSKDSIESGATEAETGKHIETKDNLNKTSDKIGEKKNLSQTPTSLRDYRHVKDITDRALLSSVNSNISENVGKENIEERCSKKTVQKSSHISIVSYDTNHNSNLTNTQDSDQVIRHSPNKETNNSVKCKIIQKFNVSNARSSEYCEVIEEFRAGTSENTDGDTVILSSGSSIVEDTEITSPKKCGKPIEEHEVYNIINKENDNQDQDPNITDCVNENIKCVGKLCVKNDNLAIATDANVKDTKTKNLKEQLMSVYKTITESIFDQDVEKTGHSNTVIVSDANVENIASFYKKCKNNMNKANKTEVSTAASDEKKNIDKEDAEGNAKEKNVKDKNNCSNCIKNSLLQHPVKFSMIPDGKSAKYCLKCSCIFESETCCYCEKTLKIDVMSKNEDRPKSESPCQSCKNIL